MFIPSPIIFIFIIVTNSFEMFQKGNNRMLVRRRNVNHHNSPDLPQLSASSLRLFVWTCDRDDDNAFPSQVMEDTQAINWDVEEEEETERRSESLGCSLEPVGRLHIFSSAHGPEKGQRLLDAKVLV